MRIDAINYAIVHDDGSVINNYETSDVILIGISRTGKTPTSLYLALQFGVKAANYPLTDDDLHKLELPSFLQKHKHKLFGLTIEPHRLQTIREERRPDSQYASLEQCEKEVKLAIKHFEMEKIPYLNTTTRSIEEIATKILAETGIKRRIL